MKVRIQIVNKSNNPLPEYKTPESSGADMRAFLDSPVTLEPLDRKLIPTGLYFNLPKGSEGQIRPRSGLAYKHGITVLNSPGTIDSDYTGEVKVLLVNLSNEAYTVQPGERIAQFVFALHEKMEMVRVESLDKETERGQGGYGSTGKQ